MRIKLPTASGMNKFERVLNYLNATLELCIILNAERDLSVIAYIDASYGVYSDCRSHTGSVLGVGDATVHAKSSHQKLTTKSSTEAEIVDISDSLSQALWLRVFLIELGYEVGPLRLMQYMPTGDMLADIMTKPLQGELFRGMRALLLGM
jgi:hypothetical protein